MKTDKVNIFWISILFSVIFFIGAFIGKGVHHFVYVSFSNKDFLSTNNHVSTVKMNQIDELILLLESSGRKTAKERLSELIFIEKLLVHSRDELFQFVQKDDFKGLSEENKIQYVQLVSIAIARCRPYLFCDYLLMLGENGFPRSEELALMTFFEYLPEQSLKSAYEILNSNAMKQSCARLGSSFEMSVAHYRMKVVLDIGLSNLDIFFNEFRNCRDEWQRKQMLEIVGAEYSFDNYEEIRSRFNGYLTRTEQKELNEALLEKAVNSFDDWKAMWELAKMMELNSFDSHSARKIISLAAERDPLGAIDFIELNFQGEEREYFMAEAIIGLNKVQSSKEILPIVNRLSDGICRNLVVPKFFQKYYNEYPDEALAWLVNQNSINFCNNVLVDTLFISKEKGVSLARSLLKANPDNQILAETIVKFIMEVGVKDAVAFVGSFDGNARKNCIIALEKIKTPNYSHIVPIILDDSTYSQKEKNEIIGAYILIIGSEKSIEEVFVFLDSINDPHVLEYSIMLLGDYFRDSSRLELLKNYIKKSTLSDEFKRTFLYEI